MREFEMARPSKKTNARVRIILEQLKVRPIEKYACSIAKIHPETLKNWKQSDPDFLLELESAKAIGQGKWIDNLADRDPGRALLASDYETYKQRTENEHSHKVLVLKKELIGETSEKELYKLLEIELEKAKALKAPEDV